MANPNLIEKSPENAGVLNNLYKLRTHQEVVSLDSLEQELKAILEEVYAPLKERDTRVEFFHCAQDKTRTDCISLYQERLATPLVNKVSVHFAEKEKSGDEELNFFIEQFYNNLIPAIQNNYAAKIGNQQSMIMASHSVMLFDNSFDGIDELAITHLMNIVKASYEAAKVALEAKRFEAVSTSYANLATQVNEEYMSMQSKLSMTIVSLLDMVFANALGDDEVIINLKSQFLAGNISVDHFMSAYQAYGTSKLNARISQESKLVGDEVPTLK